MRCYFSSDKSGPPDEAGSGYVSFVIPELKITFRARHHGTLPELEYASLLALLEFVDINPKVFEDKVLEVLGDSPTLVHQVNQRLRCRKEVENLCAAALIMKRRIPYSIGWIPPADNPAGPHSLSL
jgi:hypothetical protein